MRIGLLLSGLLFATVLWADSSMVEVTKATTGLSHAKAYLRTDGVRTVLFPAEVPKPTAKKATYFVYAEMKPNNADYILSFDNTADCHGAHYCNVGSISTELQGNPTIYFDQSNQAITEKVTLKDNRDVYYTPSHAMGSFWPGRVEWRCGETLTTLSWALPAADERAALLQMVDSMWEKSC